NKADLRPLTNIQDVIEEIIDTLEDYDIEFDGISAYSSLERREIDYFKKPLFEFINERNTIEEIKNRKNSSYYRFKQEMDDIIHSTTQQSLEPKSKIYHKDKELINETFDKMLKVMYKIFKDIRTNNETQIKNNKNFFNLFETIK
ncbi:hypothetical protein ACWIUA_04925, partial [Ursidibacter sp. B-7004-1]